MSRLILKSLAAQPDPPGTGKIELYSRGNKLYLQDSNGGEIEVSGGSGSGGSGSSLNNPVSPFENTDFSMSDFPNTENAGDPHTAVDATQGGIILRSESPAGMYALYKDLDNETNYRITFMVLPSTWGEYSFAGMCLRNSADGRIMYFGLANWNSGPWIVAYRWSDADTYDGVEIEEEALGMYQCPYWIQLEDDGAYWTLRASYDGVNFFDFGPSLGNTTWFGELPDQVGICIASWDTTRGVSGWFRSWLEEDMT